MITRAFETLGLGYNGDWFTLLEIALECVLGPT